MTLHIRPLRPADREAVAALFDAAYPERAGELARWDDRVRRWVAADGARIVGYGSFWAVRDHRFRMDLTVAPEGRRRGTGGRLLDLLVGAARAAGASTLQARTESDRPQVLAFLNRRGFAETMRMHRLVLNVASATPEPYAGVERRLAAEGIVLTTLEDEQHRIGEACWHRLCAAYHAARDGWPDPYPDTVPLRPPTVAEFRRMYEEYARLLPEPEPCVLAVHGEEVAGFAGAIGTGVRPALRGRGIATALKLRAIAGARERGVTTLHSTSGNPAMLKVNERLGYRRTTTEVRLVRRLQQLKTRSISSSCMAGMGGHTPTAGPRTGPLGLPDTRPQSADIGGPGDAEGREVKRHDDRQPGAWPQEPASLARRASRLPQTGPRAPLRHGPAMPSIAYSSASVIIGCRSPGAPSGLSWVRALRRLGGRLGLCHNRPVGVTAALSMRGRHARPSAPGSSAAGASLESRPCTVPQGPARLVRGAAQPGHPRPAGQARGRHTQTSSR